MCHGDALDPVAQLAMGGPSGTSPEVIPARE
jgi:hypothetical protein